MTAHFNFFQSRINFPQKKEITAKFPYSVTRKIWKTSKSKELILDYQQLTSGLFKLADIQASWGVCDSCAYVECVSNSVRIGLF